MASAKASLKAAKSALDAQKYQEAASQANEVLQLDPESYYGHVFLGRALEKQQKLDEAVVAYQNATKIKPGEELAWKGLCNAYESQGAKHVKEYINVALELAKIYAEQSDQHQCQTVVDKLVSFAKDNGSRQEYMQALEAYVPSSPIYDFLEGRIPNPSFTYIKLASMIETDEKERINRDIGDRRTRLGAKLGQVTAEVTREVYEKSNLEKLYQSIIDWTNDDETRREYEEKLLQRAYTQLTVLPSEAKAAKRDQVLKLAHDMVVIKHPLELAWRIELEWHDLENLDDLDKGVLLEYIEFFPDSGLAKVIKGFFGIGNKVEDIEPVENGASSGDRSQSKPQPISVDERLLLFVEELQDCKDSGFAHRLIGDHYLQIEEYESCVDVSRRARELIRGESRKSGLSFENNQNAVKTNLATALIYYQSPKNHPEAKSLFDQVLQQKPNSTMALLGIGLVFEEQQDYENATDFLDKALLRDPNNTRIGLEAAWCRALNGEMEKGLAALELHYENINVQTLHGREMKAQTSYRIGRCLWELHPDKASRKDRKGPYSHFLAAIKANPNLAPAYTSLGVYYDDYAGDKKRARQCFQKAFEQSSSEIDAAERLAKTFANEGDWEIVEIVAQRVIDSGFVRPPPGSKRKGVSWPFAAMGVVQMNRQEFPKAVISFQSALRISPGDYHSWIGLGESYHSSGRYNAAQRTLEHAKTLEASLPQDQTGNTWFAAYMLANVQRELGEYGSAIDGYKAVLESRPHEYGVSIALLQTLVEQSKHNTETGFYGAAADCAREAIVFAESSFDASQGQFNFWKAIGDACSIYSWIPNRAGDLPLAQLQSLLSNNVDDGMDSLEKLDSITTSKVFSETTKEDEAEMQAFGKSLYCAVLAYKMAVASGIHDKHAEAVAWYNLGWAEFAAYTSLSKSELGVQSSAGTKFSKAAVRCFKRSIELEAGNSEFWNALGVVTSNLNPGVAQHSFIRSLHLNERNARTWTNLGCLYMLQGDNELAHSAFSRAQSTDPEYAHAWVGEGLIALLLGDHREALSHFTHAVEIVDSSSFPVKSQYATSAFNHLRESSLATQDLANLAQPVFALQQIQSQAINVTPFKHLLGLLCERIGDFESASSHLSDVCTSLEAEYERSESLESLANFITAKANLARVQLAARDFESAAENGGTALDLSADADSTGMTSIVLQSVRLSAHLTAGLAKYYADDSDGAMEMFRSALEESGGAPDVVCLLAQVLWAKGGEDEKETAKEQLFDCIERHAGNVAATTLLGAISALDEDDATQEAVLADLRWLRTEEKLSQAQRRKVESLLGTLAELSASESQTDNEELAEAQVSIFLSPSEPSGWSNLSEQSNDLHAAEMTVKLASQSVPPHGTMDVQELSSAFAAAGSIADLQRSVMLCPWQKEGWEMLYASLG